MESKDYEVIIIETLEKTITVSAEDASSPEDACEQIRERHADGDIVLDGEDVTDITIELYQEHPDEPHIVIVCDGYCIAEKRCSSKEKAQQKMRKMYESDVPKDHIDEFKNMSYCNTSDAILYTNGDRVLVYKVIAA